MGVGFLNYQYTNYGSGISKLSIHSFAWGQKIPCVDSGQAHSVLSASTRARRVDSSKSPEASAVKYHSFPSAVWRLMTEVPSLPTRIPTERSYISLTRTFGVSTTGVSIGTPSWREGSSIFHGDIFWNQERDGAIFCRIRNPHKKKSAIILSKCPSSPIFL